MYHSNSFTALRMIIAKLIIPLVALITAPFVSATAGGQFRLDHTENASRESPPTIIRRQI